MTLFMCCKGCEKREANCHSKCPDYLRDREATLEISEKRFQANAVRFDVNAAQWNGYKRTHVNKKLKGKR